MPRTAASNGIRPEFRALDVIKLGVPVSPNQINDYVGTGPYASKYISILRMNGFEFDVAKTGRNVIAYTLTKEPTNANALRNQKPKQKAQKPLPVPRTVVNKQADNLLREIGLDLNNNARYNGEVGNYTIDNDFDSFNGDVSDLILDY